MLRLEQSSCSDDFENIPVQVLVPVVLSEFTLLEVQVEHVVARSSILGELGFGDASKALNAIDVVVASRLTIRI